MDLRSVIGKAVFKEPGGKTLHEARARQKAFLQRTDALIAEARGPAALTTDALLEALPGLTPQAEKGDMAVGLEMLRVQGLLTSEQAKRGFDLLQGVEKSESLLMPEDLLELRRQQKEPASRTYVQWVKALEAFMNFCQVASPLSCTREMAEAYKQKLLGRGLSKNTVKVQLAYLSGLWTSLSEARGVAHIFKGLPASVRLTPGEVARQLQKKGSFICRPINEWDQSNSQYLPIFQILYYSGCRLSEVCGLKGEDINDDRFIVTWSDERSLKTHYSQRQIPLHPQIYELMQELRRITGLIWPSLKTIDRKTNEIRWGHNLSKPCKQITGLSPKDFRDRVTAQLVELDYSEKVIGLLLGHSPRSTTQMYGGSVWKKVVEAVHSLS